MKLARIILPDADADGRSLYLEHRQLQALLLEVWSAFTRVNAVQERNSIVRESVVIYEIAMERADVEKLRETARLIAKETRLDSVTIVTPCGDVEFVKP